MPPIATVELKPKPLILDEIRLKEAIKKDGSGEVCCITPGWGSSGYYSESVLKEAAEKMRAGTHMYWDHPTISEEYQRPERSLRDLAGILVESAEWKDNGWNGPGVYASAKAFQPYLDYLQDEDFVEAIGISLVAYGTSHTGEAEGETGDIIDSITAVRSVDFVTLPGRGGKIKTVFESLRYEDDGAQTKEAEKEVKLVDEHEAKSLRESNSALNDEVKTLKETVNTVTKERDAFKEENESLKEKLVLREAKDEVRGVLDKVESMPEITKSRLVETISGKAPLTKDGELDKHELTKMIEEAVKAEVKYLESLGFGKVDNLGGSNYSGGPNDDGDDDGGDDLSNRLSNSFQRMGLTESAAKLASEGR